jgi:hypothetical protein
MLQAWQLLIDGALGEVLVDYLRGDIGEGRVEETATNVQSS